MLHTRLQCSSAHAWLHFRCSPALYCPVLPGTPTAGTHPASRSNSVGVSACSTTHTWSWLLLQHGVGYCCRGVHTCKPGCVEECLSCPGKNQVCGQGPLKQTNTSKCTHMHAGRKAPVLQYVARDGCSPKNFAHLDLAACFDKNPARGDMQHPQHNGLACADQLLCGQLRACHQGARARVVNCQRDAGPGDATPEQAQTGDATPEQAQTHRH